MRKLIHGALPSGATDTINELIGQLDALAEATIKEARWGSAPFHWARNWQKNREED